MGDHKEVFRSLQELFPQVDPRMLKAIAIEHKKDVDSAVVAVLDEVMPSMTGMTGSLLSAHHEAVPFAADSAENLFANSTSEVGSSSSAGHETCIGEVNGSVHSAHQTSSVVDETITQEHVNNDSYIGGLTQMSSEHDYAPNFDVVHPVFSPKKVLANEVGCVGYLSTECFSPSSVGAKDGNSISIKAPQLYNKDSENITAIKDCISQNNSSKSFSGYMGLNDVGDLFLSGLAVASNDEVSPGTLSNEKDALEPLSDVPMLDTEVSSVGLFGAKEQQDTSNTDSGYNEQPSGNAVDNGDTPLSSNTDMLPDLNLNHFASTASTHSNHSVSIESLEDSISDARSIKNDLLPSLETVTKMIEDVELLEEKAKVAKHESSVAGKNILAKVEELKEMLTHAKEANDMHACEVSGEKSILTTEARELQSRLQRLSDERNRYLVVIEVIRQTLDERLVAAQQEIAAAEKEKIEKEAAAQALLEEQEKMMNSIVEESRRLQQEAEDNLKLKEFLVERGRIVDTLQGEMAVICEDVSQLKRMVDERVPLSKLHRSTMSSLSSSLHSSDATSVVAVESTDKHTVAEATAQGSHGNCAASRVISKRQDSNEGWDFVEDVQE